MGEPLVSVVTPFYNTAAYLSQCIESVLGQSYRNFEYLLVDNCSTDGSRAIAARYAAGDARIRLFDNTTFVSQSRNYNQALRRMSPESRYCKVVQADDWIFAQCLEEMVRVAEAHPTVGIVGAFTLLQNVVYLDGLPYPSECVPGREVCRRFLLDSLYVWGSQTATMVRADLVRKHDPFYDEASPFADVDACFELLEHADFGFVHQVLTFTRRDNESITSAIRSFDTFELTEMMAIEKYGPRYLSAEELAHRSRAVGRRYYAALAEAVLRRRPPAYWTLHRRGLASAGHRLGKGRLALHVLGKLGELTLNPLNTVTRIAARLATTRR